MEKELEELWKEIRFNQSLPLIGTNKPGEGNGFNDRISFDIPYNHRNRGERNYHNWLYSVYFRDLASLINPNHQRDDGEKFRSLLNLKNASEGYRQTLEKYSDHERFYRRGIFLDLVDKWGKELVYQGRVAFEFVGWYDNTSKQFYAYQLVPLDFNHCKIRKKHIVYFGKKQEGDNLVDHEVKIPVEKCVIINWPDELGGYKNHKKITSKASKLFNEPNGFLGEPSPFQALKKLKTRDNNFYKMISSWGTNHLPEGTTEFYKQCVHFRLKRTTTSCTVQVLQGVQQLIELLNSKLNENAKFTFEGHKQTIISNDKLYERWLNGSLSFKEANEKIQFR